MSFKAGRPMSLTPELKEKILAGVSVAFRVQTTAYYVGVHPNNLKRWLKDGAEDAARGECTLLAQFWAEFHQKQAEKVTEWLRDVEARKNRWQASWELVKSVAREDYGVEAVEYKELLELFNQLTDTVKRLTDPTQGATNYGREMDSESHSETQGTSAQETESEEGQTHLS